MKNSIPEMIDFFVFYKRLKSISNFLSPFPGSPPPPTPHKKQKFVSNRRKINFFFFCSLHHNLIITYTLLKWRGMIYTGARIHARNIFPRCLLSLLSIFFSIISLNLLPFDITTVLKNIKIAAAATATATTTIHSSRYDVIFFII